MQIFQKGKNSNVEGRPFVKFTFGTRWEEIAHMPVNVKFGEICSKCVRLVGRPEHFRMVGVFRLSPGKTTAFIWVSGLGLESFYYSFLAQDSRKGTHTQNCELIHLRCFSFYFAWPLLPTTLFNHPFYMFLGSATLLVEKQMTEQFKVIRGSGSGLGWRKQDQRKSAGI